MRLFSRRPADTTALTDWTAPPDRAARRRRAAHHRTGADRAARQGQAWETTDRNRERNRRR
ncbi:hypothetical protein [Streptomyces sp. NPDC047968]|uniref:hypothetical protein n=1 Tax=Streptomyces TaxID=1883 RepID=UPI00341D9EE4